MIVELAGRSLIEVAEKDWEELPKGLKGLPVYYRRTATGFDVWPMWQDYVTPIIRVEP